MKKVLLLLFISGILPLSAMPPHPDSNLENREHRTMADDAGIALSRIAAADGTRILSSPSSGTVKLLVILVGYGAEEAAFPLTGTGINPVLFLIIVLIAALLFLRPKKKLLILSVSAIFFTSGCPDNSADINYGDRLLFQSPASLYNDILQAGNSTSQTMKKYFDDMSNGLLSLDFDIKGPYNAPHGWQYYGENDSNGYDKRAAELAGFAVDQAQKDGVDFSVYDNDDDGSADTVIVIHAGRGEETGADPDTVWSHNWTLSGGAASGDGSGARYYDGVTINNYTMQPEYTYFKGDSSIGVFCHEFGHVLGLPDLYDTSGETRGVGSWSLMSGGSWGSGDGEDPAPLLAWERYDIGGSGWIEIQAVTSGSKTVNDIESAKTAFRVNLNTDNSQYLLLEGKTEATGTEWFVPETGILITQINEDIISLYRSSSNTVNAGYDRVHGINIVEAKSIHYDIYERGSLWNSGYSSTGTMCFRGSTLTTLTPSGTPDTNYYSSQEITTKTVDSSVTISGMSGNGLPMTFSVE